MGTKVLKTLYIGLKLISGISAGYFVMRATQEKADDLCKKGGAVNKYVVCVGQTAFAVVAGELVYWVI